MMKSVAMFYHRVTKKKLGITYESVLMGVYESV